MRVGWARGYSSLSLSLSPSLSLSLSLFLSFFLSFLSLPLPYYYYYYYYFFFFFFFFLFLILILIVADSTLAAAEVLRLLSKPSVLQESGARARAKALAWTEEAYAQDVEAVLLSTQMR